MRNCKMCGIPLYEAKYINCKQCREYNAEKMRNWKKTKIELGLCPDCGKSPRSTKGQDCEECGRRRAILKRERRKRIPSEQRSAIHRRDNLQRKFGITPEEYDEIFDAQNGKCLICGREMKRATRYKDAGVVDHDHVTGKIRGILHNNCNRALGLLGDDLNTILGAFIYLANNAFVSERVTGP